MSDETSTAPPANAPLQPPIGGKTEHLADIIARHFGRPLRRMLVVGCGSGREAAVLARRLRCEVVGIDIATRFDVESARHARLEYGDATSLSYPDESFDYVYSYHALEHIPRYVDALAEMRRVLEAGGGWCIGTPNRHRLIGYLGSNVKRADMMRWNLADWRMRLAGRFRNEYGAHAGFGREELRGVLCEVFGNAVDVSLEYYFAVYRRHAAKVKALDRSGFGRLLFPSVYFVGRR